MALLRARGRRPARAAEGVEAAFDAIGLNGNGLRREEVYDALRHAIVTGRLPEGERLVEARLAQALSISRTPVREALHKLEHEGLVTPLATRGFIVRRVTPRDVGELFQIRLLLEPTSMREGAMALDAQHRRQLSQIVLRTQRYLETQVFDMDLTLELHDGFHEVLLDACPSHMLRSMVEELRDRAAYLDRKVFGLGMYTPQHRQDVVEELPKLHAVIAARHWETLQEMIAARLTRARAVAMANLGSTDKGAAPGSWQPR